MVIFTNIFFLNPLFLTLSNYIDEKKTSSSQCNSLGLKHMDTILMRVCIAYACTVTVSYLLNLQPNQIFFPSNGKQHVSLIVIYLLCRPLFYDSLSSDIDLPTLMILL